MARKTKKTTTAASTVRNIRRNSRKKYSGEEKIRIVLEGLRGEETIAAKHETSRLEILRRYAGCGRKHGYMDNDLYQQVLEWIAVQETIEAMEFELTVSVL